MILALAGTLAVSGCAPLVVGGAAATTAVVATDRRTAGEQVEDQAIELKASSEMRRLFEDRARVTVTSYAGRVLLTGDVPDDKARQQAQEAASGVEKVREVYNELRVGAKTPMSVRTNDTWLTSKVKTALVNTKGVPTRTMLVTTERGIVYLLGRLTRDEAERATKVVSGISGVQRVVKAFEIVAAESLITDPIVRDDKAHADAPSQDAPPPQTGDDVQAMPVE